MTGSAARPGRTEEPEALGGSVPPTPNRVWIVAANGVRQLVVPLANFVVSYLVVRTASAELWGAFVVRLVLVTLTVHVLAWGNHELLMRAFSRRPADVGLLWRRSLATRGVFLAPAVAGAALLGLRGAELGWTALWLAAALGHQSLAVVVLYTRRFGVAIAAEAAGLAATVGLILAAGPGLDLGAVVRAVAVGVGVRLVVGLAAFAPRLFDGAAVEFDVGQLVEATPFFLTGLAGLLSSKADLLVVTAVLDDAAVGAYQVLLSFFTAVQAVAGVAVTPFLRELYRAPDAAVRRFEPRLLAVGLVLVGLSVPAAHLVLNTLYGFDLAPGLLGLGALYALPTYGYLLAVYRLYRRDREVLVAGVCFATAGFNAALTLALVGRLGVVGALAAAVAAQWLTWAVMVRLQPREQGRSA